MMETIRKHAMGRAGFSFAELMVVIALVGILSAIAAPSLLRTMPEKRLKNAARNLYGKLQQAKLLAVKENRNVAMTFNPTNGTYAVAYFDRSSNTAVTPPLASVRLSDDGNVRYGQGSATQLWIAGEAIDASFVPNDANALLSNTIIFVPTGTAVLGFDMAGNTVGIPDNGANIYLQNESNSVCYAASVNQFGGIRLRRFDSKIWQ